MQQTSSQPQWRDRQDRARATRVFSITSGKGGVGKTTVAVNLGILLQRRRKKVLLLDANVGLSNIDLMLGMQPEAGLLDLLEGKRSLREIIVRGPAGIDILPAGSDTDQIRDLTDHSKILLKEHLAAIDGHYDYVLIDTSAGISQNVLYFNLAAHAMIVVITPEPTSIRDAHSLTKILFERHSIKRFQILVNEATTEIEGRNAYRNFAEVADKHLGDVSLGYLGSLQHDPVVSESIRLQKAAVDQFPDSCFVAELQSIASRITGLKAGALDGGTSLFGRTSLTGTSTGGKLE